MGQGLRFVQEYFLVACSLADLVRRFRRSNADWNALPEKVAIQLNDTHPTLAVPELMRILLDEASSGGTRPGISRSARWPTPITRCCPEALEKWPLAVVRDAAAAPSGDHLRDQPPPARRRSASRFPGDEGRVARVSLIEEGRERKIRMANLAIVGSHSTNGVAAIHSELLRTHDGQGPGRDVPRAVQQQDQRRDAAPLAAAGQPGARRTITDAIGDGWITDLAQLAQAQAARRRRRLPRRRSQGQARGEDAVCRLAQGHLRPDGRPGHDLRLPGQAHPRVQAAAAERAAHRGALQPAARESRARRSRRARSSSPARRRPPTTWPSSSSSSSTIWPARSTATRPCGIG